jgi:hypothetical protein
MFFEKWHPSFTYKERKYFLNGSTALNIGKNEPFWA